MVTSVATGSGWSCWGGEAQPRTDGAGCCDSPAASPATTTRVHKPPPRHSHAHAHWWIPSRPQPSLTSFPGQSPPPVQVWLFPTVLAPGAPTAGRNEMTATCNSRSVPGLRLRDPRYSPHPTPGGPRTAPGRGAEDQPPRAGVGRPGDCCPLQGRRGPGPEQVRTDPLMHSE